MVTKELVVLANSIKKQGRCVAGREIIAGKPPTLGGWVRPISSETEGELHPQHMATQTRESIEVGQVVEVPLEVCKDDPCHPEDWLVTAGKWRIRKALPVERLAKLEETPVDLWLEHPEYHTDRVSCGYLRGCRQLQSLYLIRPENFHVSIWQENQEHTGYPRKRTRAIFDYRGAHYDLGLTDPRATERHCRAYPAIGEPPQRLRLPCGDNCLLCVSLTPPFNGPHYKVVATILELP